MNHAYKDILDRIAEEPKWWDENAVPRYSIFGPREVANIYAREVALVEIACQGCGRLFLVAFSRSAWETAESARGLGSFIKDRDLHYGDPPNVSCCHAGATMNSIPVCVVEYWHRQLPGDWERDPALEIDITPEWAA